VRTDVFHGQPRSRRGFFTPGLSDVDYTTRGVRTDINEYRQVAEECFKLAGSQRLSALERGLFLGLALTWRQLAEDAREHDKPVSTLH
jgi:hypothetical protein